MSARERNLETVRRWSETFDGKGLEAVAAMVPEIFHPDIEFSPLLAREIEGRTCHGHDELLDFYRELYEMLGAVRYGPPEYRAIGDDTIVLLTRLEGSGRESAVPVDHELGLVYEFRDGLVGRMTAYGSHDEALAAAKGVENAKT